MFHMVGVDLHRGIITDGQRQSKPSSLGLRFEGGQDVFHFVAELHNVLNSSAGQSSFGTLTRNNATQAAFEASMKTVSYFGRVQEIVAPRVLKIGFKVDF